MTVFPSSIKNKQGPFFSTGEVVCSLYCTGNCRLESSCVIVTGMQRIWRRARALFSYHMCFSVVEVALLHTGNTGYLRYLPCGVFLQVSGSENKCPSCRFTNKACINKAFIAVLLLWDQKILIPSVEETQDFFAHLWNSCYLPFDLGVSGCHSHAAGLACSPCMQLTSVPWWAHLGALLHGWGAAMQLEGNLLACVQYGHGLCVPAQCHVCVCGAADSQESMWKHEHGQRVHSCGRSA